MKSCLVVALLLLTACGTDGSSDVADDPDDPVSSATPPPDGGPSTPIPTPAPPRTPVGSGNLVTVIGPPGGPVEVCFGAVAESAPPQCDGSPVDGWTWRGTARGVFEDTGGTRWGSYQVQGRWDGSRFTVTGAIPAALYDAAPGPPTELPSPATSYDAGELQAIADRFTAAPAGLGAVGASVQSGRVVADLIWDDGTVQRWADDQYGTGVVVITTALQAAGPIE